ncbi:MFS transporter [Mesoplasma seiffertii]|uniref:MFS transporter n=1 Tax=Mesoplasma seiffertii TaxID=28224 RepID=UPI001B7FDFB3|nr:MFS transporter [Mesoplasma seiffertii]
MSANIKAKPFAISKQGKFKSKWLKTFPLVILALADVAVFAIPSYMENFLPNVYSYLGLHASEYSQGKALYGYLSIPCYILGVYIGDKFKSKYLIGAALGLITILATWYMTLPFINALTGNKPLVKYQLYVIFCFYSFAKSGLFWAPLWKLVKNNDTEDLVGAAKEQKVGKNNGIQGSLNGLFGLTLAGIGILLLTLNKNKTLPNIVVNNYQISSGFFVLVSLYLVCLISATIMVFAVIKEPKVTDKSFSLKAMFLLLKNWQIWALGILVLGVYMLQMGLSSYINYLDNIFLVGAVVVSIIGIFRTYVMRFLISPFAGRAADKSHSYILWMCIGLFLGIILILIAIILPGFKNDFRQWAIEEPYNWRVIAIKVAACLNLIILGALTWAVVTIRWSPIATEMKVPNYQYAAVVNIISIIAFTPDAFFQQVKAKIEAKHYEVIINPNGDAIRIANQTGNQIILAIGAGMGIIALIFGIVLYIKLHKTNYWSQKRHNKGV